VRKEFRKEHTITDEEWEKWNFPKGDVKVVVYRPHILRTFRNPYDYYFPIGTQVVVKNVRLFKKIEELVHPSGRGEELEPVEESLLEAPREFILEYLEAKNVEGKTPEEWFLLQQKRVYPPTPIEELAKRDFSLWVIHQHLIGEYGKKGERGLRRDNLLDIPIIEGKAHWDFRFQRVDLKTGKVLDTLEWFDQLWEEPPYVLFKLAKQGWTLTKPPSNIVDWKKKILVVPKAIQPKGWLFMKGTVPIGQAGAGTKLRGHFHILEREFGIKGDHEPNFREYFLFGKKWNGRFVVRRVKVPFVRYEDKKMIKLKRPVYRWTFWKTKDQSRFVSLLKKLRELGRKIPNQEFLFKEYVKEGEEGFLEGEVLEWAMPLEVFKEVKDGIIIEGVAINVGETRNRDIFTYDALLEGAKSLIDKPLELDHVPSKGQVVNAWFEKDKWRVRYQAIITDPYTQQLAREGKLKPYVSVRAGWSERPWVNGYLLKDVYFKGLSLLYKREPADPRTSMKIIRDVLEAIRRIGRKRILRCKIHGTIPLRRIRFDKRGAPFCPSCNRQLKEVKYIRT